MNDDTTQVGDATATNEHRWCYAWFAGAQPGAGTTRAALQKDAKWNSGVAITVRFLEGNESLQERVREVARRWTAPGLANLRLVFNDSPNADIRIAFMQGEGSWSTVGTTCRLVPQHQPTMNFGWLTPESSDEDVRSVVLHEFGHALGLIHEHQHPKGGIKWNRDAVRRDLSGPPNNWSDEEIEFNVLEAAGKDETNHTATIDLASIMMYAIPAGWTLDGFSTRENSDLSARDRAFIREQYT